MFSSRPMNSPVVAFIALGMLAIPASAQRSNVPGGGLVIGGAAPPAATHERCVEVEIGRDRSFNCINEQLKRQVDRINPVMNVAPIDATSQDIRVGVVNQAAVQQQYGSNFGRSVIPFRPVVVVPPLGPRR